MPFGMDSLFASSPQYRIEKLLGSEDGLQRALARDLNSNTESVVLVTEGAHARRLLARKGLKHRHLATLLSCVEGAGAPTFVAEHVPGLTLYEARAKQPIDAFKALIWFTRLLEALAALHDEPAVHGAVSPLSIIVEPEQRAIAPVLTQLLVPALGAYCSPERLSGEAPTPADDTWSLLSSLYFAITGKPPFGSESSEKIRERVQARQMGALSEAGVDEPELERLFVAAFHPDPSRRLTRLTRIRDAFDKMERGEQLPGSLFVGDAPSLRPRSPGQENEPIVFNEQAVLSTLRGAAEAGLGGPRPKQASLGPDITLGPQLSIGPGDSLWPAATEIADAAAKVRRPRRSSGPPPFAKKKAPAWALAFAAGVGVAAVVVGLVFSRSESEVAVSTQLAVPTPSTPNAKPLPKQQLSSEQCLLSYFPTASFVGSPSLEFFCQTKNFSQGTSLLFALVRAHAAKKVEANTPPPAEDARAPEPRKSDKPDAGVDPALLAALPYQAELGWYDLAAAAIMKRNCCGKPEQNIDLERTPGYCPQLTDVVQALADASALPGDLSPQARRFDEAVTCLITTKVPHGFGYEGAPTPESRAGFQRFLTYAAVSDAKRSAFRK